jgi:hypothetical protein|tara:strand:+ start:3572 stop:3745 length:174 start_codon:yes stop_codon:yes gene_type:complete
MISEKKNVMIHDNSNAIDVPQDETSRIVIDTVIIRDSLIDIKNEFLLANTLLREILE